MAGVGTQILFQRQHKQRGRLYLFFPPMFKIHTVMAGSLLFHPLLLTLLLVTGPGERVEGGFLTTPACIAACLAGPCAGAAATCKCRHYFLKTLTESGLWIRNDVGSDSGS
jgi:hypothetical protein